jgi:hypothetical protein
LGCVEASMDAEAHADLGLDIGRGVGGCSPTPSSAMGWPPPTVAGDVGKIGGCAGGGPGRVRVASDPG